MPTKLSTINYALIQLGEQPLPDPLAPGDAAAQQVVMDNALDDAEKLCVFLFEDVAKTCLEAALWQWAIEWAELTPAADRPPINWLYRYDLPADWASTVAIAPGDSGAPVGDIQYARANLDFEMVRDGLYSNYDRIWLGYIQNTTNPAKWSATFERYVAFEIASRAARTVRPSGRTQEKLESDAREAFMEAKRKDGVDQTVKSYPTGNYARARVGGYPGTGIGRNGW